MNEKPRTWTLEKPPGILDAVAVLKPREMRVGQKIRVIELEPMLDLLEPLFKSDMTLRVRERDLPIWKNLLAPLGDLLREHGRLK